LISLAGIAIPLWGVHVRERAWDTVPPKPRLKRAAYDDELLELLQRPHLTMSDIELIKGLHDICDEDRRTNPANTISGDLRRRVDALLGKYR
jgi:hypothetical protein